jgi:Methyltransferase domain
MGPDPDPTSNVPGMAIWGWMSPTELQWLATQAATMRTVVEIGCLHGRSSYALATACPGTVYCIDPWNDDGWKSWWNSIGSRFDNVHGIREPSPAAGAHVPDPVDMVFIDGAHDYGSVAADINYWLPRTKRLLCGHDYVRATPDVQPGFPDVAIAVDELLGPDNITVAPDTAIWTYRPAADR